MPRSVACPVCGRRLKLPDGFDAARARCPGCRTKFDPRAPVATRPAAVAAGTDATAASPAPAEEPPAAPLSLDDSTPDSVRPPPEKTPGTAAEPLSLDDADAGPVHPAPDDSPERAADFPPPYRVGAVVVAAPRKARRGPADAVLTPFGLFLEVEPDRPFFFAPVGADATADGAELTVGLPDGPLTVAFEGVFRPAALAADAAAFLAGERAVPAPRDYRRPWWLLLATAAPAAAVAAGPVALGRSTALGAHAGWLVGIGAATAAFLTAAAVALLTRWAVRAKVAVTAGTCAAVLLVALFGLGRVESARRPPPDVATGAPTPSLPAAGVEAPPSPPEPPPPPEPHRRPPTHVDLALRYGRTRIDAGPADVTALAMVPAENAVLVGYANGQTRVVSFDGPAFDPPRDGPRADGPVRRAEFDPAGRVVYLTVPGGVVAAPRDQPPDRPVKLPGDPVAAFPTADPPRFAAVRGGRVLVRDVPLKLVLDPSGRRPTRGVVLPTPGPKGDEVMSAGVKADYLLPSGRFTFLAWHPTGRLLGGTADGAVVTWPLAGPKFTPVSKLHGGPVRAWAAAAATWDFATGDETGKVCVWPGKELQPTPLPAAAGAVTDLAFDTHGTQLAVADAAGGLTVWDLAAGGTVAELKRPTPARAVTFGPTDDLLLVADGAAVDVLWLPAVVADE